MQLYTALLIKIYGFEQFSSADVISKFGIIWIIVKCSEKYCSTLFYAQLLYITYQVGVSLEDLLSLGLWLSVSVLYNLGLNINLENNVNKKLSGPRRFSDIMEFFK